MGNKWATEHQVQYSLLVGFDIPWSWTSTSSNNNSNDNDSNNSKNITSNNSNNNINNNNTSNNNNNNNNVGEATQMCYIVHIIDILVLLRMFCPIGYLTHIPMVQDSLWHLHSPRSPVCCSGHHRCCSASVVVSGSRVVMGKFHQEVADPTEGTWDCWSVDR